MINFQNRIQTLKQWSNEFNIDYNLLYARYITQKWDFDKCLFTKSIKKLKKEVIL